MISGSDLLRNLPCGVSMLFLWELCQNTVRLIMITTVSAFVK